ncbi:MAG: hypothetical protein OXC37_00250, partial [Bdellovibrionaceae bacterium]|nr:hypothetical protein [Pseudobdellovibrionaceae bacterium]
YPAMKLTGNTTQPLEFVTAPFKDAQKVCFEMGREKGKYYDLAILLFNTYQPNDNGNSAQKTLSAVRALPGDSTSGLTLASPSNLKFDFINNVSRGLFLAPPSSLVLSILPSSIEEVIKAFISSEVANRVQYKLWTAMEWDASGAVVVSPPWALVAKDHPFSFYFSKSTGRPPILLEDTTAANNFSAERYMALSHNIRWKGLLPQPQNKQLPFVCQKDSSPYKFFITTAKGTANQGVEKCKKVYGKFVPPESSMDWVKLMLDLNKNDSEYPYPNPKLSTSDMPTNSFLYRKQVENPMAWVALTNTNATNAKEAPLVKNLRLSRPWPAGSIFLNNNIKRSEIKNVVGAGKYMTTKGVAASLNLPNVNNIRRIASCGSSGGVSWLNIGSSHSYCKANVDAQLYKIEDYHQLCVKNKLPHSLRKLTESCPSGTIAVDLNPSSKKGTFEPFGFPYMAKYVDTIDDSLSNNNNKIILYDPSGTKEKIKAIQKKISEVTASCAYFSCRSTPFNNNNNNFWNQINNNNMNNPYQ